MYNYYGGKFCLKSSACVVKPIVHALSDLTENIPKTLLFIFQESLYVSPPHNISQPFNKLVIVNLQ